MVCLCVNCKSSSTQFWPILGRLCQPLEMVPFVIRLFCGEGKPANIEEYLHDFVEEMSTLQQGPVHIEGHNHPVQFELSCFICDTPAPAYIKQVTGHSGYYGYDKCKQKGAWDGKVNFPEVNVTSRSDVHFDEMVDA